MLPKELRNIKLQSRDIFDLFFPPSTMEVLVKDTNLCATKTKEDPGGVTGGKNGRWKLVTSVDIYKLLQAFGRLEDVIY